MAARSTPPTEKAFQDLADYLDWLEEEIKGEFADHIGIQHTIELRQLVEKGRLALKRAARK